MNDGRIGGKRKEKRRKEVVTASYFVVEKTPRCAGVEVNPL